MNKIMIATMDWTSVILGVITCLGGCGWVIDRKKHRQEIESLKADIRQKDMELAEKFVVDWETHVAEPLKEDVRELREKVQRISEELENVKKNACYCAGCHNRISVL